MSENLRIGPEALRRYPHLSGISPETVKLIERLKTMTPGEFVTDDELSKLIGKSTAVQGKGYSNLRSATRYVLRHYGLVIERISATASLKCLNADETIHSVDRDRRHIARTARHGSTKISHVDFSSLPDQSKSEALALKAQLGALAANASTVTTKRLAAVPDLEVWQSQQRKMLGLA